jgi:hypothetical protein
LRLGEGFLRRREGSRTEKHGEGGFGGRGWGAPEEVEIFRGMRGNLMPNPDDLADEGQIRAKGSQVARGGGGFLFRSGGRRPNLPQPSEKGHVISRGQYPKSLGTFYG